MDAGPDGPGTGRGGEPAAQRRRGFPRRGQPDGEHLRTRAGCAADPGDAALRLAGRLPRRGGRLPGRHCGRLVLPALPHAGAFPRRRCRRRALLRLRARDDRAGRRAPAHGGAVPGAGDPLARLRPAPRPYGAPRDRPRPDRDVPGLPRRGDAGLPGAGLRAVRPRVRSLRPGHGTAAGPGAAGAARCGDADRAAAAGVPALVAVLRAAALPRHAVRRGRLRPGPALLRQLGDPDGRRRRHLRRRSGAERHRGELVLRRAAAAAERRRGDPAAAPAAGAGARRLRPGLRPARPRLVGRRRRHRHRPARAVPAAARGAAAGPRGAGPVPADLSCR